VTAAEPRPAALAGQWPWIALAVLLAACYATLAVNVSSIPSYFVLNSIAFILFLAALALLRHRLPRLSLVWAAAVVFRVCMWLTPPTLSDDVYRYIWDGHVAVSGVNPYAYPVDSPALDNLTTPLRPLINNPWMASPYLPAAQWLFAGVAALAPQSLTAFQVVMASLDLLAGGLLAWLLRRVGRPPALALVYLWNPLGVVEFAGSAHLDALMIALSLAALAALLAERRGWSAVLLALATLTKGIPALLLAALWPRWRGRDWLIYAGVPVGAALPYTLGAGLGLIGPRTGVGLFGAIREYTYQWNFNGSLYHLLEGLTTGIHAEGAVPPATPGAQAARLIAAGLLGLVLLAIAWRARAAARDDLSLLRLSFAPLAAYLLLATTVHPWYVTCLLPLAAFEVAARWPGTESPASLAFSALAILLWSWSVGLSYATYLNPAHLQETALVRWLEYAPVYALAFLAIGAAYAMRRKASIPVPGR
jgi:alpha-1,6-mannosyltransferase